MSARKAARGTDTRRVSGGPLGRALVDLPSGCVVQFELRTGTVEACVRDGQLRLTGLDGRLAFTSESTNRAHVQVWP